jgi:ribose 1,5-bisphosphokinase
MPPSADDVARRPTGGMSWITAALRSLRRSKLIGPGRLVLVVGPSGAGKDTLIAHARAACRGDARVVFPARVVTRPPSAFENNEFMPPSAFDQAAANGAFAIWWSAHGQMYGIPLAVDFDIKAGRTVACNVSRTVVGDVRARYANVVTVLVTAPQDVLRSRLAARERASDGRVSDRMSRLELADGGLRPDLIINNVGDPESGARKLVDALYARGVPA